jgi:hypothetical protein
MVRKRPGGSGRGMNPLCSPDLFLPVRNAVASRVASVPMAVSFAAAAYEYAGFAGVAGVVGICTWEKVGTFCEESSIFATNSVETAAATAMDRRPFASEFILNSRLAILKDTRT